MRLEKYIGKNGLGKLSYNQIIILIINITLLH